MRKVEDIPKEKVIERSQRFISLFNLSGLTRKEFAQVIGRSTRSINLWKTGDIPIFDRNACGIVEGLKNIGVFATVEWLLENEGEPPVNTRNSSPNGYDLNIFKEFNLDFSLASVLSLYQKIYPSLLSLYIQDDRYSPSIPHKCLLIATPIKQEKFQEDWPYGYLYEVDEHHIIPVNLQKNLTSNQLIVKPYKQKIYSADEFFLDSTESIFPVILLRPIY